MAKLENTIIEGDLVVAGNIVTNVNDYDTNKANNNVVYNNPFSYSNGTYFNYVPMVVWHGKVICDLSPTRLTYQSSGCDIVVEYISNGVCRIVMSGDNAPNYYRDYQLLAIGMGTTNTTSTPAFVTIPDSYKENKQFRLIITDQASNAKIGSCELSIIKMVQIT